MKKLFVTLLLISLVCIQFAVTITTTSGLTIKGDISKKINDLYYVKTDMGERVVNQQDIAKVMSDSGYDVTASILEMTASPELSSPYPDVNKLTNREFSVYLQKMQYHNQKKIWILSTGTTIAVCGFAYILFNNSYVKKPWKKP